MLAEIRTIDTTADEVHGLYLSGLVQIKPFASVGACQCGGDVEPADGGEHGEVACVQCDRRWRLTFIVQVALR